ncbi:centromere protein Scm3-domain-containing protein [Tricharina praecox]|uniref:centromere protein Scm3-domain-containing protein n=1 Tax=Tricharina praecox TaxID=43433 RepID=UPI00221E7C2E|nr:centromere protein Scm3-domain-containing protein [Tricharina praecox]KAI5846950.1 centromere protein Scm3-domain-containing protein [Tricharina praecox]
MAVITTPQRAPTIPTDKTTLRKSISKAPRTKTPRVPLTSAELAEKAREKASADEELLREREACASRLRESWELIFEKYGKDFDGCADEIDLDTGELLVDNGYIRGMVSESEDDDEEKFRWGELLAGDLLAEGLQPKENNQKKLAKRKRGKSEETRSKKSVKLSGDGCEECRLGPIAGCLRCPPLSFSAINDYSPSKPTWSPEEQQPSFPPIPSPSPKKPAVIKARAPPPKKPASIPARPPPRSRVLAPTPSPPKKEARIGPGCGVSKGAEVGISPIASLSKENTNPISTTPEETDANPGCAASEYEDLGLCRVNPNGAGISILSIAFPKEASIIFTSLAPEGTDAGLHCAVSEQANLDSRYHFPKGVEIGPTAVSFPEETTVNSSSVTFSSETTFSSSSVTFPEEAIVGSSSVTFSKERHIVYEFLTFEEADVGFHPVVSPRTYCQSTITCSSIHHQAGIAFVACLVTKHHQSYAPSADPITTVSYATKATKLGY